MDSISLLFKEVTKFDILFAPSLDGVLDLVVADPSVEVSEEGSELLLLGDSLGESLIGGVVHQRVPGVQKEYKPDLALIILLKDVLDGNKVLE